MPTEPRKQARKQPSLEGKPWASAPVAFAAAALFVILVLVLLVVR